MNQATISLPAARRGRDLLFWAAALGTAVFLLVAHIEAVQAARGVQGGFGFLFQAAGFRISESLLDVAPEDPYWMSLAAGLVNTLTVAVVALPLATLAGVALGLMRLSRGRLCAGLAAALIAPLRNTPVLLQLFVWYGLLLRLPDTRAAWEPFPHVMLSNRGLALAAVQGLWPYALSAVATVLAALGLRHWLRARGRRLAWAGLPLLFGAAVWIALPPLTLDLPVRVGLGLRGGWQPSIEFAALTLGLAVFHAAYIADIVRASVRAVPAGLVEAGQALALSPWGVLRNVVAPTAVRVALPAYANQCLALIKNSTLAIAIGYQELMAVINTAITQTGRALEGISLAVGLYLALALALGGALSAWNTRNARYGPDDTHGARLGDRPSLRLWPERLAWRGVRRVTALCAGAAALVWGWRLFDWSVVSAVWRGGPAACEPGAGACWAAVGENLPLLVFGAMQPEHRPQALVACVALLLAVAVGLGALGLRARARLVAAGIGVLVAGAALSGWPWGGMTIGPLRWGGLVVTLVLALAALLAAVPIAAVLALARRNGGPGASLAAAALIEAVRGVPLVTQLLFASFVLPMLLGNEISKFGMALAALTLHTACLLAEVLRGALQAIPAGQMAAARALGMTSAVAYWTVIWPQVRRIAAPAALGVFVGALKDTSLVSIIGVFDVLGAAKAVVAGTAWRPYHVEVYLAVAALYFGASLALSRVARAMESGRL